MRRIRESLGALGQLTDEERLQLLQELGLSLVDKKADSATMNQVITVIWNMLLWNSYILE